MFITFLFLPIMQSSDKFTIFKSLQQRGDLKYYKTFISCVCDLTDEDRRQLMSQIHFNRTQSLTDAFKYVVPHALWIKLEEIRTKLRAMKTNVENRVSDAYEKLKAFVKTLPKVGAIYHFILSIKDNLNYLQLLVEICSLLLCFYYQAPWPVIMMTVAKLLLTLGQNETARTYLMKFVNSAKSWLTTGANKAKIVAGSIPQILSDKWQSIKGYRSKSKPIVLVPPVLEELEPDSTKPTESPPDELPFPDLPPNDGKEEKSDTVVDEDDDDDSPPYHTQGKDDEIKVGRFAGIKMFVKGLFGMQDVPDKQYTNVVNKMRAEVALLKDTNYLMSLFHSIVNTCKKWLFGVPSTDALIQKITEWEALCSKIAYPFIIEKLGQNQDLASQIRVAYTEMRTMAGPLNAFKQADPVIYERFSKVYREIAAAMLYVTGMENASRSRHQPVVVHFHGPPKQGKSKLVEIFAQHAYRYHNSTPVGQTVAQIAAQFSVNLKDQYRDGYNGQTVWEYNDPFQNLDKETLMNFMTELIAIGQDSPAKLNMADLSGKMATYFTSPFVCLTSNGDLESILNHLKGLLQDPQAVRRRIHWEFLVKLTPEASKPDHKPALADWEFTVTKSLHPDRIKPGTILNYEQVLDILFGTYKEFRGLADDFRNLWELPKSFRTQGGRIERFNGLIDYDPSRELTEHFGDVTIGQKMGWFIMAFETRYRLIQELDESARYWFRLNDRIIVFDDLGLMKKFWTPKREDWIAKLDDSNRPTDPYFWAPCDMECRQYKADVVYRGEWLPFWLYKRTNHATRVIIGSVLESLLIIISFIITYIIIMLAVLAILKLFFPKDPDDGAKDLPERTQVKYPKEIARHAENVQLVRPKISKLPVTQGGSSSFLFKNVRAIAWVDSTKKKRGSYQYCFGIKDNYAITTLHFFHNVTTQDAYLRVTDLDKRENSFLPAEYVLKNAVQIGDDLALFEMPGLPKFRDVVNHFHTEDTISQFTTEHGIMLHREIAPSGVVIDHFCAGQIKMKYNATYLDDLTSERYEMQRYFSFAYPTEDGMCGDIYTIEKPGMSSTICGLHVGGNDYSGLGTIVSRDVLISAFEALSLRTQSATSSDIWNCEPSDDAPRVTLPARAKLIKVLPSALANYMPSKHEFEINRDFWDLFTDHDGYPAEIRDRALLKPTVIDGVKVDPVQVAVDKIGDEKPQVDSKDIPVFLEALSVYSDQWPVGKTWKTFDEETVLHGCSDYFKAMNMNKSAGIVDQKLVFRGKYSLIRCSKCGAQKDCSCPNKKYILTDPTRREIESMEAALNRDEIVPAYFSDILKSELRKKDRVKAGKSRLFSAGPFSLLYLGRKLFGAFMDTFNSNPFLFCSGIGINPHSTQWAHLHHELNIFAQAIFADAANWDANMLQRLCLLIHEKINEWYRKTREHYRKCGYDVGSDTEFAAQQRERMAYAKNVYNCLHVLANVVYQVEGNPSGQALTALINTLYNNVCTLAAAILFYRENINSKVTAERVNALIRKSCTGDDVVLTHDIPKYTCAAHAQYIARFGIKLTPADKSPTFQVDHYALEDGDYLKRRFVQRDGLVVAPLDALSVYGACNWKSVGMTCEAAARAYFPCFQIELFHYGPDIFERDSARFLSHFKSLYHRSLPSRSYRDIKDDFINGRITLDFAEFRTQSGKGALDDRLKTARSKRNVGPLNRPSEKGKHVFIHNVASKWEGKSFSNPVSKPSPNAKHKESLKTPKLASNQPIGPQLPPFHKFVDGKLKVYANADDLFNSRPQKTLDDVVFPPTRKLPKLNHSWVSDKDLIDDMFGEKKPRSTTLSKNKADSVGKFEKSVLKLSPNIPDLDDDFVPKVADPLPPISTPFPPEAEEEPEPEEAATPEQPVAVPESTKMEEISARQTQSDNLSNPINMPKNPISQLPTFKRDITRNFMPAPSNLKRRFRPNAGNVQATQLLRVLGMSMEAFEPIRKQFNIHRYRDGVVFSKTSFHYAKNNLYAWAKKNKATIETDTVTIPSIRVPMAKVTVKRQVPNSIVTKEYVAYGVDIDTKNMWKFAFYNMLIELSFKGEPVDSFFTQSAPSSEQPDHVDPIATIDQTMQIDETRPVSESVAMVKPLLHRTLDPYPDQTPVALLTRKRVFTSFTFDSTQTLGDILYEGRYPFEVYNDAYFANLLTRFRLNMFDVDLEIRFASNMMQAGSVMWCFYPGMDVNTDPNIVLFDVQRYTSTMMVRQDISTGDVANLHIPGMTFMSGFNSDLDTSNSLNSVMGLLRCYVLAPLSEPGATGTVTVTATVYITLRNPKGYAFRAQSGKPANFKAKPNSAIATTEPMRKADSGTLSTALDSVSDISSALTVIPQAAPFASSIGVLTKLAGSVARFFGHSMSTSVESASSMIVRSLYPTTLHHGQQILDVHALSVDSKTATDVLVDPGTIDYNLFDNYKLLPAFWLQQDIASSDSIGPKFKFRVGPQFIRPPSVDYEFISTPSSLLASQHALWRGDMNYHFEFVCSRFTTFRVRISWLPRNQAGLPTSAKLNDVVSRIIDINGPTTTSFSVPYLSLFPMLSTTFSSNEDDISETATNGIIVVELLNKVQVQAPDVQFIWINIYAACGPNMVFSKPSEDLFLELTPVYKKRLASDKGITAIPKVTPSVPPVTRPYRAQSGKPGAAPWVVNGRVCPLHFTYPWLYDDSAGEPKGPQALTWLQQTRARPNPSVSDAIDLTREKEFRTQSSSNSIHDIVAHFRTVFPPIIPAQNVVMDRICVADHCVSFTERYSKPTIWKTLEITAGVDNSTGMYVDLKPLFSVGSTHPLTLLNALFSVHRGSIVVVLVAQKNSYVSGTPIRMYATAVYGNQPNTSVSPFSMRGTAYSDGIGRNAIAMSFPMYGQTLYRNPDLADSYTGNFGFYLSVIADTAGSSPSFIDVLVGLGDDYMVSVPRPTPLLTSA